MTAGVVAVAAVLLALTFARLAPPEFGGGTVYLAVADRDMEPAFQPGDLAMLRPGDRYRAGDVVAIRRDGRLVLRRIVADTDGRLLLKSDAGAAVDPRAVEPGAIVGGHVATIPLVGGALTWLAVPLHTGVVAAAVAGAGLVVLVLALWPRRRRRAREPLPLIVEVSGALDVAADVVDVVSYDDLLRLAAHHRAVVLEERADGARRAHVEAGATVFRYVDPSASPQLEATPSALGLPVELVLDGAGER